MEIVTIGAATLHRGDCLDVLRSMPDNSVDSVVTDPPYGLSFMGKKWDYDVPAVEVWAECLRVLKPGGHLLAFAGTRTQHRMAVRIEDAGFEIRDMIAWVYGSGFPKSLDVSKAIDKARHAGDAVRRATAWIAQHATARALDNAAGTNGMGGHWTTQGTQAAVPTAEAWMRIAHLFPIPPEWFSALILPARNPGAAWNDRPVTREATAELRSGDVIGFDQRSSTERERRDIPSLESARQWQGWGTALKPALEPITVARKPLAGTVAANVQQHGTGALNIDGCRVEGLGRMKWETPRGGIWASDAEATAELVQNDQGRFPANVIHDGSDEVVALFPDSDGAGGSVPNVKVTGYGNGIGNGTSDYRGGPRAPIDSGSGSAARFFYCAKASREDRNEGIGGSCTPAVGTGATMRDREDADWTARNGNDHPTVKPTDLMRYLCRLVTPPGGIVLDPFMGSGSTGKAAMPEGFRFVGIEREQAYFEIAGKRIEHAQRQPDLFNQAESAAPVVGVSTPATMQQEMLAL